MSNYIKSRLSLIVILAMSSVSVWADQDTPKTVHLIQDGSRLVASNVSSSSFHEVRLVGQEGVLMKAEGDGVLIVATNKRFLAYGALSGWKTFNRLSHEEPLSVSAEDYAAVIVTNRRLINFNGETGVWGESRREVSR